jgi:hemoglobin
MLQRMIDRDQLFARIGGEAGVRRLVDRFYDLMDALPEARQLRALHPEALAGSRDKLCWFLVGWLGGPPLYVERFGHPRLRARHLPFAIGRRERDQWVRCMEQALAEELAADAELCGFLGAALGQLADHMRNRPEPEGSGQTGAS